MSSYDTANDGKIMNISSRFPQNGRRAVGDIQSSGILPEYGTYTDTTSISPELYYNMPVNKTLWDKAKSEGVIMEDNKLLEMYIDKVDKDQRDLKEDVRESEKRTEKRIDDSNKKFDERMSRLENLIISQTDKIDGLQKEVQNQLSEDKKYRHSNNIAIALGVIATVISMIGIYYATVSMITDIIGVAVK